MVLTHHGVEGGHLRHLWELRNPLPAGVPVGDDGFPLQGVRADMQVLLDGQGGTIIAADVTTTAAVPIAAQPRFAANGDLEAPTIPQRLLSQSGAAAADGERDKRKLYGDRWNVVPAGSLSPLSFEVHGAASSSTHAFFERVAQSVFPGVGQGPTRTRERLRGPTRRVHLHAPSTHLRCAADGQRRSDCPLAPPLLELVRPCGCGRCCWLKRWPSLDAPILRPSLRRSSHYYFNPFLSSQLYSHYYFNPFLSSQLYVRLSTHQF